MVSQSVLPIKAAINSIMNVCNKLAVWLPRVHDHNLFDTQFQHEVGTMSLEFLPIKSANSSIMYNHYRIYSYLPDVHDLTSLTLLWRLLCHRSIHTTQLFDLASSVIHIVWAAFLAFSFTFFLITTLFINSTNKYILIFSKILCHSINAHHHVHVRSIGCSGIQNGC